MLEESERKVVFKTMLHVKSVPAGTTIPHPESVVTAGGF